MGNAPTGNEDKPAHVSDTSMEPPPVPIKVEHDTIYSNFPPDGPPDRPVRRPR
jgi:hypothetical protein